MKVFIYMNEQIKKRKPTRPVIVLMRGSDLGTVAGNTVVINGPSIVRFDPRGLPFADGHHVTAWIEADSRDVMIR
jgi:hypothetical protein